VIHGVSNEGPLPFLVMPYLRSKSLQRRLDRQGSLPPDEIVRTAQQVASGLAAAHGQGLAHRDIKPANTLLEEGVELFMKMVM
jgi:serine/threonine protein kinase